MDPANVLEAIRASDAEGLIIDLTGVWMVDSHLCSVLSKMASSARLMGANSIMCGMSAEVAVTLQTMGIDLVGVRTALTLEEAFHSLGIGRMRSTDPRARKRGRRTFSL